MTGQAVIVTIHVWRILMDALTPAWAAAPCSLPYRACLVLGGDSVRVAAYVLSGWGCRRWAFGRHGWSGKRSSLLLQGSAMMGSFIRFLLLGLFHQLWIGLMTHTKIFNFCLKLFNKEAEKVAQISHHQKTKTGRCVRSFMMNWFVSLASENIKGTWQWLHMPNHLWNGQIFGRKHSVFISYL